ncbi:xanthine dehydrogenase family protein molybdopterin-binding subunit [bacterium CG_4_9_14_3_um_filter_65_15]|nr:MAG: xanthine dehydrogenase family protein molybdopterin-binding subunit [bacterium CG_4_9_14_3_um_filter_65_15]
MNSVVNLSRRDFLKTTGVLAGALILGFRIDESAAAEAGSAWGPSEAVFNPNAWLEIDAAGTVVIQVPWSELGQGPLTAVPMLLADELEADWETIEVRKAWNDPRFGNMGTGGSRSVRMSWDPVRQAGAAAREMLIAAAAARWGVSPAECRAQNGEIHHATSGRSAAFGELAADAALLEVPTDVPLKKPAERTYIGKSLPRVDTLEKITGEAVFGLDTRLDGMLFAAVARPPAFGDEVETFDAAPARRMPGVRDVVQISSGVAALADSTWQAIGARDALKIQWRDGGNRSLDSEAIAARLAEASPAEAAVMRRDGDATAALRKAASSIKAVYELPFISHSPMEPMNCTARIAGGLCEVWVPTQSVTWGQNVAAQAAGVAPDKVRIYPTYSGGGFGRRLRVDYVQDAVELAKAAGRPVQVVMTREDDTRHGFYRPTSRHTLEAGLDAGGRLAAWSHHLAAPSISGQLNPASVSDGRDESAVDGAATISYGIENLDVLYSMVNTPVPVCWLRSVYNTQNALANEAFLDEVARAAGRDPLEMRRGLLAGDKRLRGTLEAAAHAWGWPASLPPGHGQGVACHACFGSFVTMIAEVSAPDGRPRVHRVLAAVDCGPVVHPDGLRSQIQGGIAYALSGLLHEEILIRDGAVVPSNFDDYPVLTLDEMPAVEVVTVPSEDAIGGIGEPGYPPLGPAVLNALFDATGIRVRRLPLDRNFRT